ncbi:IP3KB-like protein [Mya arenaria]|uniref:Kinase n=1 Tax=Mya arenaria TaxID=6604 RepID=A0ABY7FCP0_MYAAR|nr:inositol-trisphosphate 3-kinase C-like isoform X2 [Mya arenaria]XP_052767036.1 inositol-trisphosphate 3-kinase C-like isoform X2 [Mya arenaria]WAR18939.1 IP3KB-like protein [Mya arenaria]
MADSTQENVNTTMEVNNGSISDRNISQPLEDYRSDALTLDGDHIPSCQTNTLNSNPVHNLCTDQLDRLNIVDQESLHSQLAVGDVSEACNISTKGVNNVVSRTREDTNDDNSGLRSGNVSEDLAQVIGCAQNAKSNSMKDMREYSLEKSDKDQIGVDTDRDINTMETGDVTAAKARKLDAESFEKVETKMPAGNLPEIQVEGRNSDTAEKQEDKALKSATKENTDNDAEHGTQAAVEGRGPNRESLGARFGLFEGVGDQGGGDVGFSLYSEEGLMEPCDCDECILEGTNDRDRKLPSPLKKQSSWKKIRNIVRWTPFIQEFKRRKYPWIQLAGHQGNFQAGEPGAILKKYDKHEHQSFNKLMVDVLRSYVPEYRGEVVKDGECYLQLQDLLCEFEAACVMDVKMGCRTYLEDELTKARQKPTLRKDMYQKMVEVDPGAPTPEEHAQKAITKPRYMQWRDDMSSSTGMGFRIEGIRKSDGAQVKNFKTTKDRASVKTSLRQFVEEHPAVVTKYVRRLKAIKVTQESSPFFSSHEVIGSSLLFVHDRSGSASIWMIDFGKTVPLPSSVQVTHRKPWQEGNHEDGYLTGIDNLISIFQELLKDLNLPMASSDEEGLDSEASSVRSNSYSQFSDSVNRDSSRTLIQSSDTVTGSNSSQPES